MYEARPRPTAARPARDLLHIAQMRDAADRSLSTEGASSATLVAAYAYPYVTSWRFS
jgi:hypothetical protein